MRILFHGVLVAIIAMVFVGGSCSKDAAVNSNSQDARAGNENSAPRKSGSDEVNSNSQIANENSATAKSVSDAFTTNAVDELDPVSDGDAMIIKVENDVRLRRKGKPDFVQIPGGLFHSGDLLRIGASSAAFVDCSGVSVCKLGTGDFSTCCGSECASRVALGPPASDRPRLTLAIAELPADEQQQLRASETKIRGLGADEITTQYLIANLYSAWKVKEAKVEIDRFSNKLGEPEANQKLHQLYWPMVKKNADLNNKMGNRGQAEQTYRKLTETKESEDQQTKAAAHVSLGQIYLQDGKKKEAIQTLQKGEKLYEIQGNRAKAETVRESIKQIQKQPN